MNSSELEANVQRYTDHLNNLARVFNTAAADSDLAVRMDPSKAIEAAKSGLVLGEISPFWSRVDDSGIVHESQLCTAIKCLVHLHKDQLRCGHVVGAMQSGKTTTSLALQWAGPALYALTGKRVYPFYIIGNQTSHEDQTNNELVRFLAYYGRVEIRPSEDDDLELDPVFAKSPSLVNYREHVLRRAFQDVFAVSQLDDLVHRRVGGEQSIKKIAELCRTATDQGYRTLMMIDEPQFGASDRMIAGEDGPERRPCVLARIFDRIEEEIGSTREDHWFVGLSATPFELNDLQKIWEVRQDLTPEYSGFNYFNGEPISPGVAVNPPKTMSLTAFAKAIDVPFMAALSLAAYSGKQSQYDAHAKKINFQKGQAEYKRSVNEALRSAIYRVIETYEADGEKPVGLCIRAFNDNTKTEALIGNLALDPTKVEVLSYFGPEAAGHSVKRTISRRKNRELPYVVFVTNRARMADAFPVEVRFFLDFAKQASDLNALLQGLLGRACGYNKRSTVVLSDQNASIVDAYVATRGGYVHKTSRHSIAVGGFRRGAPTGMIKVRIEMDDPIVKQFFDRIDQEVVGPNIPPGSVRLSTRRAKGGYRTGPILRIAESIGLFDHLERPEVRTALFPQLPSGFKLARPNDTVRHARKPEVVLRYTLAQNGDCRYTFRWSDRASAAQGGAAGRAMGKKDSAQHMEPTIYVEKFDATSGSVIDDRLLQKEQQQEGNWRAFMVTFPVIEPVRETRAADVAYPVSHSPYDGWMEDDERARRDQGARVKTGLRGGSAS